MFFMNDKPFFRLAALVAASWIVILSCSKSSSYNSTPPPGGGTGNNIGMSGMSFSPASKTVTKGSVVKWTNNDSYAHTVTSNDGITFDSGNIAGNGTYSYTANTAGTFDYHCTIHGMVMSGTLIVTP
jgi:plastocyanin